MPLALFMIFCRQMVLFSSAAYSILVSTLHMSLTMYDIGLWYWIRTILLLGGYKWNAIPLNDLVLVLPVISSWALTRPQFTSVWSQMEYERLCSCEMTSIYPFTEVISSFYMNVILCFLSSMVKSNFTSQSVQYELYINMRSRTSSESYRQLHPE